MIARQKVDQEVLSFYVTLPFTHQIVLVDLVNKTVHAPMNTCFDEAFNQCLRPQFLGAETNNVLLVTTRSGFLGINTQTGEASFFTNPNMNFAGRSVDGEFNRAQVGLLGPPTAVPGHDGLYLVADRYNHNLRLIDTNEGKIFSICRSEVLDDLGSWTTQTSVMVDLPPCNLDYPYSVMFKENSTSDILVNQRYRVTRFKISCKCEDPGANNTCSYRLLNISAPWPGRDRLVSVIDCHKECDTEQSFN